MATIIGIILIALGGWMQGEGVQAATFVVIFGNTILTLSSPRQLQKTAPNAPLLSIIPWILSISFAAKMAGKYISEIT